MAVHLRLPRTSAASGADAEALKDAELSDAEASHLQASSDELAAVVLDTNKAKIWSRRS